MTKTYQMVLDGLSVELLYQDDAVGRMLAFLLCDMQPDADLGYECIARFVISRERSVWLLFAQGVILQVQEFHF